MKVERKISKDYLYKVGEVVNETLRIVELTRDKKYNRKSYIVQSLTYPNPKNNYELEETALEQYSDEMTQNGKNNLLLDHFTFTFKKGGNSSKTEYTVKPMISSEVNEFVLNIIFKAPMPKMNPVKKRITDLKLKYNKYSFNVRNFIFQSIFKITKFFHLKKGNTVLFTSDSRAEMSGNFEYVYNEMLRQNLDKKQIFRDLEEYKDETIH